MAKMQSFDGTGQQDELKIFLRAIKPGRKMSAARYRLMTLLGFWHGLRISELVDEEKGLKRENLLGGFIQVDRLKNSESTVHKFFRPSDPELQYAEELMALVETLAPGERLFPITRFGAWEFFQRTGAAAGVNVLTGEDLIPEHKRHPHVLKHTTCRRARKNGMSTADLRIFVGHKTGASTLEYDKPAQEEAWQAFAAAVGK